MNCFFRREYQLKQSFNTTVYTRIQSLRISASFYTIPAIADIHLNNMATVINKSVGPIGYGLMGEIAQILSLTKAVCTDTLF